jgi:hypothetical protein
MLMDLKIPLLNIKLLLLFQATIQDNFKIYQALNLHENRMKS